MLALHYSKNCQHVHCALFLLCSSVYQSISLAIVYLCITDSFCGLLYNAVSISDYTASNGGMIGE
jgi:hypothetical protein